MNLSEVVEKLYEDYECNYHIAKSGEVIVSIGGHGLSCHDMNFLVFENEEKAIEELKTWL